ncbi:hypothetical protein R3I93_015325 [Phoxinus phoxinus]|uniref:Uncharacterized protein n=1 Tax=Phoxinus phoxinus TaxID=58324 RepID=A0AAN9CL86_9TELE
MLKNIKLVTYKEYEAHSVLRTLFSTSVNKIDSWFCGRVLHPATTPSLLTRQKSDLSRTGDRIHQQNFTLCFLYLHKWQPEAV